MPDIQFHFTEEQRQFRDMLRRFMAAASPTSEVRRLMDTDWGFDPAVWRRMADELGLAGLMIPERYGGSGFGLVELGLAMEEMGRVLLCAPYLASAVLAANALCRIGSEAQKQRWLPGIASGETLAALAFTEPGGEPGIEPIAMPATAMDGGYSLSGCKDYVVDGCNADLLLVAARTEPSACPQTARRRARRHNQPASESSPNAKWKRLGGLAGLSLFAVAGDASGVSRRRLQVLDPTRQLARLGFEGVPAELLGDLGAAGPALAETLDIGAIALANEMAGGAQRLLEDTLEYIKLRMQFGRAVASFQAIKHRCAELLLEVELMKSAAYHAAQVADANPEALAYEASLAKAAASEAYLHAAIEAIQLHGGIGFTWDQDTQLWYKRAKSSEVLLGDPAWHRERMIQCLEGRESTSAPTGAVA